MMRSPDLQYCLISPFLWFDGAANALVTKDLERAEKFLKEMKEKKDALDQINTAYQSMYCATQALLHSINYKSTGFRAIVTVLEEYFLKKGILEPSYVEFLLRGQKMEGTPQENFEAAQSVAGTVKKVLNR